MNICLLISTIKFLIHVNYLLGRWPTRWFGDLDSFHPHSGHSKYSIGPCESSQEMRGERQPVENQGTISEATYNAKYIQLARGRHMAPINVYLLSNCELKAINL